MLRPFFVAQLELRRYLADRGDLAFSLALPIVLFALMNAAFGGDASFNGTAHLVDLDRGALSIRLASRLEDVDGLTVKSISEEKADSGLDRANILTAVVIPAGFTASLESGEPTSLVFRQRGAGGGEGQIVEAIARGVAQDLAGEYEVRRLVQTALDDAGPPSQRVRDVVGRLVSDRVEPPVGLESRTLGGDSEDVVDRLFPGILTMFLMFAVTLAAASLVLERQNGTLERLLTTPLGINQLFFGKFLAGVFRATVQALILMVLAFVVLRPGGPAAFLEILVLAVLVAAAVSTVGLVIAALARTRDQAAWIATIFTMFMTVFGGTFVDVGDSGPLSFVSKLTINKYAIDSMESVLSGTGRLLDQGVAVAVMVGVAIVGLAVARSLFKVSEGGR